MLYYKSVSFNSLNLKEVVYGSEEKGSEEKSSQEKEISIFWLVRKAKRFYNLFAFFIGISCPGVFLP